MSHKYSTIPWEDQRLLGGKLTTFEPFYPGRIEFNFAGRTHIPGMGGLLFLPGGLQPIPLSWGLQSVQSLSKDPYTSGQQTHRHLNRRYRWVSMTIEFTV